MNRGLTAVSGVHPGCASRVSRGRACLGQVLLLVLLLAAAGCGDRSSQDPSPAAEVMAGDSPVRLVDRAEADLLLYVSNQSFEDTSVPITVVVDGVTVVDGDFAVEDQHHWIEFPLALEAGSHEVTARSESGATLRESFETSVDGPRYAVIDHWGKGSDARFSWLFQAEPIGFA